MSKGSTHRVADVKAYKTNFESIFRNKKSVVAEVTEIVSSVPESSLKSEDSKRIVIDEVVPWYVAANAFEAAAASMSTRTEAWANVVDTVIKEHEKLRRDLSSKLG